MYAQKPESALKRAEEFITVGQHLTALEILYDNLVVKRYRTYTVVLDSMMMKYFELCVSLQKGKFAKEGLGQFKNLCQNVNIQSLEVVIKKFIELAEEKVMSTSKVENSQLEQIEDLEASFSPEALLMMDVFKEKGEKVNMASGFRFLWESYRSVLDVLKNNSKLEILYQSVCSHAFDFCVRYKRANEFRRLCEVLRGHLNSIQKYPQQTHAISMANFDSFQVQLEIRFNQLESAVKLELWQEAYKTVDDIHEFLRVLQKPVKPSLLVSYFRTLALIFQIGEAQLFHAGALNKLLALTRSNSKLFGEDEKKEIAVKALMAALCVPIPLQESNLPLSELEIIREKELKMASYLGMGSLPSRQSLLKDCLSKDVLKLLPEDLLTLYKIVEGESNPIALFNIANELIPRIIEKDSNLRKYLLQLYRVILMKFFSQISEVYSSMTFEKVSSLVVIPCFEELKEFSIEKYAFEAVRLGEIGLRIDYERQIYLFSSKKSKFAGLSDLYKKLLRAESILDQLNEQKAATLHSLKSQVCEEYEKVIERRQVIEKKKEKMELYLQEKERIEAKERAARFNKEQEAEKLRLLEESKKRDLERMRKEKEEIERQEAKKLAESMKKEMEASGKKLDIDNLDTLDKKELLSKQMEQIDKERKAMEIRLNQVSKRMDYFERAVRKEEIPLILQDYALQKENDKKAYELIKETTLATARTQHAEKVAMKMKLLSMKSDFLDYRKNLMARREEKYLKEKEEKERLFKEEKAKRIEEAKAAYKAEQDLKQQQLLKQQEQRQLELSRQEELKKQNLAKQQEEEERRAKQDKIAEIQRQKEKEIAERLANQKNYNSKPETSAPTSAPTAVPRTILPQKEGGWRSRAAEGKK